jgi:3-oxoacyl-[acyl-carrier-protein] synthase II
MPRDPIVITAVAAVTPLGLTAETTWRSLLAGRDALGPLPALEQPSPDNKGGYQAPDLPPDFAPALTREARYLRWTILDALAQLADRPMPPARCGIVLGTTLHGMRSGGAFLRTGDLGHLSRFLAAAVLREATAGLPIGGDAVTTCSACSSSLGSIALAATLLETRQLDRVIAGGYDAVSEYAYGGFNALRLVTDGPPRPFARDRRGMKLGEGYGIVVLERATDGGRPIATLLGWGESADAHHLTQPHPTGRGAAAAITAALARAAVAPADVDLIAAHATATPDNDAGEAAALAAVFGPDLPRTPVVAFKSHLGHTLGGAGAVELVLSALALRDGTIPPTAHTQPSDIDFPGLSLATGDPRAAPLRRTLNTSLGFGGANTAVILSRPPTGVGASAATSPPDVFITGVAVLLSPTEAQLLPLLNARRVRRLSDYVKLTLAATALALRDAGFTGAAPVPTDTAVLLGTAHGSFGYAFEYYRALVDGGFVAANPMLFAEGVPNAAAAHVSLTHGLTGACQTLIGSRTAGLDALRLAAHRIANGDWDRAVVGAAEERSDVIDAAYRHAGHRVATAAGAVTLILESRRSIEGRGGRPRGVVSATAAASGPGAVRSVLSRLDRSGRFVNAGDGQQFAVAPLVAIAAALDFDWPTSICITGYDGTAAGVTIRSAPIGGAAAAG